MRKQCFAFDRIEERVFLNCIFLLNMFCSRAGYAICDIIQGYQLFDKGSGPEFIAHGFGK
jgi:hypothetical protein